MFRILNHFKQVEGVEGVEGNFPVLLFLPKGFPNILKVTWKTLNSLHSLHSLNFLNSFNFYFILVI